MNPSRELKKRSPLENAVIVLRSEVTPGGTSKDCRKEVEVSLIKCYPKSTRNSIYTLVRGRKPSISFPYPSNSPRYCNTLTSLKTPIPTCQCPRQTSPTPQMRPLPRAQSFPLIQSSTSRNYNPSHPNNKTSTSLPSSQPSRNMSNPSPQMTAPRSNYTSRRRLCKS